MLRIHVFATGHYISFIKPLIESATRYLQIPHEFALYTNNAQYNNESDGEYSGLGNNWGFIVTKMPWPIITLLRYHCMIEYADYRPPDYHMLLDADMLFKAPVGPEILSPLTLTAHPGFWRKGAQHWPYETRGDSAAAVVSSRASHYFAGGVVIGERDRFMAMCKSIAASIDADLKRHVIAKWHDESYLNAWAVKNPPARVLSPSYCYSFTNPNADCTPRIVALDKTNPAEMRG